MIALRSNGVMNERRTATSTSRVTSSAAFSCSAIRRQDSAIALLAGEHRRHRVGAGDEDLGVALEHVEEAVLLRHDRANDVQHPIPPGELLLPPITTSEAPG